MCIWPPSSRGRTSLALFVKAGGVFFLFCLTVIVVACGSDTGQFVASTPVATLRACKETTFRTIQESSCTSKSRSKWRAFLQASNQRGSKLVEGQLEKYLF